MIGAAIKRNLNAGALGNISASSTKTVGSLVDNANSKVAELEIGSKTKFIHDKIKMIQYAYLMTDFSGILCCIVWYESNRLNPENTLINSLLLYMSIACSTLLIPMSFAHKCFLVEYYKYKTIFSADVTIWSAGYVSDIFWEVVISFIMPYEQLSGYTMTAYNSEVGLSIQYFVNDIMCTLVLIRIASIFSMLFTGIKYNSNRANRICHFFGIKPTSFHGMKCYFKNDPFTFVFILLVFTVPMFAFAIRVCELPISKIIRSNGYDSYINCVWWVVVTMSTIGYGDYYPKTVPGRAVAVALCIWGVIMVSLMVVSLTNYVQYDNKQKQTDFMIKKLHMREEVQDAAASLIGFTWKCYYYYKGKKGFCKNILFWNYVRKFKNAFIRLKTAKKELRNHIVECDVYDRFI